MIDLKLLETDFDVVVAKLETKKVARDDLQKVRDLLIRRRSLLAEIDPKRARVNKLSKEAGELMKTGRIDEAEKVKIESKQTRGDVQSLEAELGVIEDELKALHLRIPNIPHDATPVGTSEEDNVVLRYEGYDAEAYKGREFRPHWEIAEEFGLLDLPRASKISGSMFAMFRNDGALLLRALVNTTLNRARSTYQEVIPPHFVTSNTFTCTGHLPKFADDAYAISSDDLWAIPTGEVPLTGLHTGEILDGDELPKRYMAYTVCFRREAGAAGKDTRGLLRLHEFHKVEFLHVCKEEQAEREYVALQSNAEETLKGLGLPYRVVELCTADLTFSSARVRDLEVYAPGVDRWLEASSVGNFTDFQARRGGIRYRGDDKKVHFAFTLNGSGVAVPRVWAAVVEHGWHPDGYIMLPPVLHAFMGKDRISKP